MDDGINEMRKRIDGWGRRSRAMVYVNAAYESIPYIARLINSPSIQQIIKAGFAAAALYIVGWKLPGGLTG